MRRRQFLQSSVSVASSALLPRYAWAEVAGSAPSTLEVAALDGGALSSIMLGPNPGYYFRRCCQGVDCVATGAFSWATYGWNRIACTSPDMTAYLSFNVSAGMRVMIVSNFSGYGPV